MQRNALIYITVSTLSWCMCVCGGGCVDVWMCGGGMTSVFLTSWLRPCRHCFQITTYFYLFFYSTFLQNLNFYQITTEPRIHGEQYETLTSFRDARSAIGWWITRVPSNGESEPSWSRLLGTRCEVSYWTPGSVSQPARPPRLGCSAPLKMLNWWAYGAVQWKKEGEPPVFFLLRCFIVATHRKETEQQHRTEPCCFRLVSALLAGSSSSSPELSWVSSLRAAVTSGSDDAIAAF